jgi:hypothetical protein
MLFGAALFLMLAAIGFAGRETLKRHGAAPANDNGDPVLEARYVKRMRIAAGLLLAALALLLLHFIVIANQGPIGLSRY